MKRNILSVLGVCFLMSGAVAAAEFARTGMVTKIVTTSPEKFGACMIRLDVAIANGCPNNGWVSLDCGDVHYADGTGKRKYATALTAIAIGVPLSVTVDNSKKFNGYCVASRIDIFAP